MPTSFMVPQDAHLSHTLSHITSRGSVSSLTTSNSDHQIYHCSAELWRYDGIWSRWDVLLVSLLSSSCRQTLISSKMYSLQHIWWAAPNRHGSKSNTEAKRLQWQLRINQCWVRVVQLCFAESLYRQGISLLKEHFSNFQAHTHVSVGRLVCWGMSEHFPMFFCIAVHRFTVLLPFTGIFWHQ